jgi:hypothetical protein
MHGEKATLANLARSPAYAISGSDRALLADFIEGKIKLRRGKPPLAYLLDPKRLETLPLAPQPSRSSGSAQRQKLSEDRQEGMPKKT